MSYNHNFYSNFRNNFTFQSNFGAPNYASPPPPLPPNFFFLPGPNVIQNAPIPQSISDQDYIKAFEQRLSRDIKVKKEKCMSISEVRDNLRDVLLNIEDIKNQNDILSQSMNTLSDIDWNAKLQEINEKKDMVNDYMSKINDTYMDTLRKLLAKRAAKRLRLKRLRSQKKREKEDRIKELKEKSRKIDENLQKIKDNINKVKQEEETKLQDDMILKEVLRKKHDAKKFITKLDALKKLHKARVNTAKGRGDTVSESESNEFDTKIECTKSLWAHKLVVYEKEEEELRAKLKQNIVATNETNDSEKEIARNLAKWREALFGGPDELPQKNFNGDLASFVSVRWQWDQFLSDDGSSIPIGWVTPSGTV